MTPVEHWLRHFLIWRGPNDPGGFGSTVAEYGWLGESLLANFSVL